RRRHTRLPGDWSSDVCSSDLPFASPTVPVMRDADDPFLLLFTSGTVGLAKGVAVPLKALLSMMAYMHYGIGLRDEDAFWNVADRSEERRVGKECSVRR